MGDRASGNGPGTVRAYVALLRGQVRSQTAYRASFAIDTISNVGATVLDVLTVLVLFRVTPVLGGFDIRQTMVIVGIATCSFATADLAVGNIEQIGRYVRTGQLDTLLVRPLGTLAQLLTMDLPLRKLSRALFGISVLVAALLAGGIHWTPGRALLAVLAPAAGALFFASIFVAGATVSFWWVESGEIANGFTYGGRDFVTYPITVYSGLFRRIFAYGMGFAFVAYYPALALLGRPDPLGWPVWVGWVSPSVAVVAAGAAALAWRLGIRHYRSTGS